VSNQRPAERADEHGECLVGEQVVGREHEPEQQDDAREHQRVGVQ